MSEPLPRRSDRPLTYEVTGLTLTPLSVMACAVPADDAADRLSAAYAAARRASASMTLCVTEVEIAAWRFTGNGMTPRRLAAAVLAERL